MPFKGVIKKVGLEFLGEGYEGAYLRFRVASYDELPELRKVSNLNISSPEQLVKLSVEEREKMDKAVMGMIQGRFINGEAPDETGKLIPVTADDLGKFPPEVLMKALGAIAWQEGLKKD